MGRSSLRPLIVLGATGSIGTQTLDVADRIGAEVSGVAARRPSDDLLTIAARYPDADVCVTEPGDQRDRFESELGPRGRYGPGSISEMAATPDTTVVNGVVGFAGLEASLSALHAGNRLALANKESIVAGGPLLIEAAAEGGGEIIPIDSEHSAIWQCMTGEPDNSTARVILTASGGPFRGFSTSELDEVSIDQALDHPTWSMGPRITADSATLMNKAFEVIEAHYLFGLAYDQIDVVIHPQSIVHSLVEFIDGVVKAEVGFPDMRKPIQVAITYPSRVRVEHTPLDLAGTDLTFERPDREAFPCLDLGYRAGRMGGTATAVLNAADEIAVAAFLDARISFKSIATVVGRVLSSHDAWAPKSIEDVSEADAWARAAAEEACRTVTI